MRKDVIEKVKRFYRQRLDFYDSLNEEAMNRALGNEEINKLNKRIVEIKSLALQGKLTEEIDKEYDVLTAKYNEALKAYMPNIQYECPICHDTGIVNNKYCNCFINRYMQGIKQMSSQSSLPNFKFSNCNFDKYDLSEAQRMYYDKIYEKMELYTQKYPNVVNKNISIRGNVGCGKTCLMSAIANALLERSINVLFFTSFELSELMRNAHLNYKDNSLQIVTDADVLIIDDIGAEPIRNNINITYLQAILDSRITHDKSTFFTTNLTALQLMNKYGERVMSRLLDNSLSFDLSGFPNLRTIARK